MNDPAAMIASAMAIFDKVKQSKRSNEASAAAAGEDAVGAEEDEKVEAFEGEEEEDVDHSSAAKVEEAVRRLRDHWESQRNSREV